MISCRVQHLEARCRQRGYTLDEVHQCIVSQHGDTITVDETHSAYPRTSKPGFSVQRHTIPSASAGPGTELKAFFAKWFGQKATPTCSCNAVAAKMDAEGPQWCRENMDWICEQVRLNAEKRGLPYIRAVVEPIIHLAIRRAEKQARKTQK